VSVRRIVADQFLDPGYGPFPIEVDGRRQSDVDEDEPDPQLVWTESLRVCRCSSNASRMSPVAVGVAPIRIG
jgi:hypothetical protein